MRASPIDSLLSWLSRCRASSDFSLYPRSCVVELSALRSLIGLSAVKDQESGEVELVVRRGTPAHVSGDRNWHFGDLLGGFIRETNLSNFATSFPWHQPMLSLKVFSGRQSSKSSSEFEEDDAVVAVLACIGCESNHSGLWSVEELQWG
jgi:hypothetical protein